MKPGSYLVCIIMLVFLGANHVVCAQKIKLSVAGFKTGCIVGDCENGKGVLAFIIVQKNPDFTNEYIWQTWGVDVTMGYLVAEFNAKEKPPKEQSMVFQMCCTINGRKAVNQWNLPCTLFHR
ncbi:MAG: hypothetical protein HWD62_18895 [Cyclobacteriaceae bacterium]|nr:MAG: hypothetical protein HWD62_18895 [Cyclobacteriaceae bacterium]